MCKHNRELWPKRCGAPARGPGMPKLQTPKPQTAKTTREAAEQSAKNFEDLTEIYLDGLASDTNQAECEVQANSLFVLTKHEGDDIALTSPAGSSTEPDEEIKKEVKTEDVEPAPAPKRFKRVKTEDPEPAPAPSGRRRFKRAKTDPSGELPPWRRASWPVPAPSSSSQKDTCMEFSSLRVVYIKVYLGTGAAFPRCFIFQMRGCL